MPELQELYYDLIDYNNNTLTTNWINVSSAMNIIFSVKSTKNCNIFCDFSKNTKYIIDSTITKPVIANESTNLIFCVISRYVRFRIENYITPVNLLTQCFYFDSSVLQNTTSNTINQVVDVSNFPTNFDVEVTNFPTGFDANITNNNLNTTVTNFPSSTNTNITNWPNGVFGGLSTISESTLIQYTFNRGTTGRINTNAYIIPFTDIKTSTNSVNYNLEISNGLFKLTNGVTNEKALLYGRTFQYKAGNGLIAKFTGLFTQTTKSTFTNCTLQAIGVGNPNNAGTDLQNFLGFGYWDSTSSYAVANFGIIYINNGVSQFIKVNDFNDATGKALALATDFSKINVFKINIQYLGAGTLEFFMINKENGEYVQLHTLKLPGTLTSTNLEDPSLAFCMFQHAEINKSNPTSGADMIGSASFKLAQEGDYIAFERFSSDVVTTITANVEKNIWTIRNDALFYGKRNNISISVDFVSMSCEGTKNVVFRIWRNRTINAPSYTSQYTNYIPVSLDTSGTLGGGGIMLFSIALGKSDNVQLNLDNLHTLLSYGDILTLTAVSTANSDIIASVAYHNI